MRLTNELMTALDEAIESVELPPETNQEDIQLRPDNLEPISNLPEETPENINDREEVRDDEMDVDKDSGAEAWEPVYPTPPQSTSLISRYPSNLKG